MNYYNKVEQGLVGKFDDVKDVASKAAEQAARLAGIFWVFTHKRAPMPGDEVDTGTMFSAVQVAAWSLTETQRVLRSFSKAPEEARAEELLNWLLKQPNKPISVREILRLGRHQLGSGGRVIRRLPC